MKSRNDLPAYLNSLGLTGSGAEIGVCKGSFSKQILSQWKGQHLFSIDSWRHQSAVKLDASNVTDGEHETNRSICRSTLKPFGKRSTILDMFSFEAALLIPNESLDFVYIDARHDYRSVMEDINLWWPLIKIGGILAGHDYKNSFVRKNLVEVKRAVDNFAFEYELTVNVTTEDNLPSWYIFKS
jgi:hypothetical protein